MSISGVYSRSGQPSRWRQTVVTETGSSGATPRRNRSRGLERRVGEIAKNRRNAGAAGQRRAAIAACGSLCVGPGGVRDCRQEDQPGCWMSTTTTTDRDRPDAALAIDVAASAFCSRPTMNQGITGISGNCHVFSFPEAFPAPVRPGAVAACSLTIAYAPACLSSVNGNLRHS